MKEEDLDEEKEDSIANFLKSENKIIKRRNNKNKDSPLKIKAVYCKNAAKQFKKWKENIKN